MKRFIVFAIYAIALSMPFNQVFAKGNNLKRKALSYIYPSEYKDWENALASGNGKMGILVFGNPLNETVIFNDRGFNIAKTKDRSFAEVSKSDLEQIKKLCIEERFKEANDLAVKSSQWEGGGEGNRHPGFKMTIDIPRDGEIKDYYRICDFETGEIIVGWKDNRGEWERRSFVSRADDVVIQCLAAPKNKKLTCSIKLSTDNDMLFPQGMQFKNETSTEYLVFRAKYPGNTTAGYEGVVHVETYGGTRKVVGNTLHITDATFVMLKSRTERYYEDCEKQWNRKTIQEDLKKISSLYSELVEDNSLVHKEIYNRVKIDFEAPSEDRQKSNEELLAIQKTTQEPVLALWERIFDAGRYYFLSSSSNQTPPDLGGIWAGDCNAGWGGYYHLDANLNIQVSGGNVGNMPEAMEGYFKLNEDWAEDFRTNARKLLGCRGLLACGNSPGPTSGLMANINDYYPYHYATGEEPWLLYPFWEHYLITGDTVFLRERLYPLLKEMGHFYEDFLVYTDKQGKYIFAGSVSPEIQPANLKVSLVNNSNFDISGAKFLLTTLIEASNTLSLEQGKDEGVERWSKILEKIPPYMINEDGALKEWAWPGLKDSYTHRHSSHLFMMWPYREVTADNNFAIFNAIANTLERKDKSKYENAGHGYLVSAFVAAGLKNSEAVYQKLHYLMSDDYYYNVLTTSHDNNFSGFCMDVCHTVPSLMMEMLVYSRPGELEFLPALPEQLKKGSISGIKGRNRVTIESLSWNLERRELKCKLKSDIDQSITLIDRHGIDDIDTSAQIASSPLGNIARVIHLKKERSTTVKIKWEK